MRARKQDKREKNRKKQMDGRERIAVLTAITLLGACGFILTAFLPSHGRNGRRAPYGGYFGVFSLFCGE